MDFVGDNIMKVVLCILQVTQVTE